MRLSPRQMRRVVRRRVGVSPGQFLVGLRVERAKCLLLAGYAIKQVAGLLGYSGDASFCRFFKTHAGMTAGQYVARACRQSVPE